MKKLLTQTITLLLLGTCVFAQVGPPPQKGTERAWVTSSASKIRAAAVSAARPGPSVAETASYSARTPWQVAGLAT